MERVIRIGVVTAWPAADWHSERLLASCARRAEAVAIDPAALGTRVDQDEVVVLAGGEPADAFDGFLLARGLGRAGDPDVQFEIYRALEGTGALVVNRLEPLLAAQDKFRTSWLLRLAGVPTPRAAVAQSAEDAERALEVIGEAVAKPLSGSLGDGVERVRPDAAGRAQVRERVARDGSVYLQSWAPHRGLDLRVFVVGGRARAAIARRAPAGEWRTNVERGATSERVALRPEVAATAEAAAVALGLDYAGVDLVPSGEGATVLEVNGNPSWRGILEATGLDMAEVIAEHVLGRALRQHRRSDHIVLQESTGAIHG
ncbi:MAG TPA: RimK family alpha-L-glutamate ligase [Anaeromyxobacter sp.]